VALGRVGGVGGPARVVRARARELDGAEHVGAQVLHGLERADRTVELASLLRVVDRHLEGAGGGADTVDNGGDLNAVDGLGDRARRVAGADATTRRVGERDRGEPACAVDGRRGSIAHPGASRATTNAPSSPSVAVAVTAIVSAPAASGTFRASPVSVQPPSVAAARRPPPGENATVPIVSPDASAGCRSAWSSAAPASTLGLPAPPARDGNGPGRPAPPSSASTTAMPTMPMPAPP